MVSLVERVVHRVSAILGVLAAACIGVLVVSTSLDVARRFVVGRSIPGVLEYSESLMVALIFLGLAYAQHQDEHVSIGLVAQRLPARLAGGLYLIGMILASAVVIWMLVRTGNAATRSIIVGEYRHGLLRVPLWPAKLVIPIGLAALLLEALIGIYREAMSLMSPSRGQSE